MKVGNIELVGSESFFVKIIDAPGGMSPADAESFVSMSLEDSCPLPPDKICRGWIAQNGKIAIFAASKEKSENFSRSGDEIPDYVVPSASLALFAEFPEENVFVADDTSICSLKTEGGKLKDFQVVKIGNEFGKAVEELREISELENPPIFKLKQFDGKRYASGIFAKVDSEGKFSGEEVSFNFPLKKLSTLDLRDRRKLKKMNSEARKEKAERLLLSAVPAAVVLLLCWQAAVLFFSLKTGSRDLEVSELEKASKEIEKRSEQIAELTKFGGDKLHPLAIVAFLNDLRPDGVVFSKVSVDDKKDVEIQGKSKSIRLLDSYVRALKGDSNVAGVSVESRSARSEAQFTIKLKIKKNI